MPPGAGDTGDRHGLPDQDEVRGRAIARRPANHYGGWHMLWTIAVVLIVLWLLGLITAYTMGGFIHVLLVIAIIVVLLRIIQGRRVL
jgi:hypothetical protein